jgi:hypothetical protein
MPASNKPASNKPLMSYHRGPTWLTTRSPVMTLLPVLVALGAFTAPRSASAQTTVGSLAFDVSAGDRRVTSPPFCFACQTIVVPECGGAQLPACMTVQIGMTNCDSWFFSCSDYGCYTFGDSCVFITQVAPDGTARYLGTAGLSYAAIAAVVGAVDPETTLQLRRPCDGAIMARRPEPEVAAAQRHATRQIILTP